MQVCIFYLVLRGLDTVEDDMAIPDDVKIPLLHCFHEKCYDRKFTMVRTNQSCAGWVGLKDQTPPTM
jgi:farnesyl-diphosphate farnesyltransferase